MSKRESKMTPTHPVPRSGETPSAARTRAGHKLAFAQFAVKSLAPEVRAVGVHHAATPQCPSQWELRLRDVLLVLSENVHLLPTATSRAHVLDAWPLLKGGAIGRKILSVSWLPEEPWLPPNITALAVGRCLEALFPHKGDGPTSAQPAANFPVPECQSSAVPCKEPRYKAVSDASARAQINGRPRREFCSPSEPVFEIDSYWRRTPYSELLYDDGGPASCGARIKSLIETAFRLAPINPQAGAYQPKDKRSADKLPRICPEVWVDKGRLAEVDYMAAVREVSEKVWSA